MADSPARRLVSVPASRRAPRRGFTLLELIIVMAIIGVLAALAAPRYRGVIDRARVAKATGDIRAIQADLAGADSLPASLADIGRGNDLDPWGRPYVYLRIAAGTSGKGPGGGGSAIGAARKDKFLVPLNSDYDLYSRGADGESLAPLSAPVSRDDVIRANNGSFIGLAVRY